MPKSHPTRGQRVSMMRALLRDTHLVCGPRQPVLPLSLVERCRGGEFVHWDARLDLALTIHRLRAFEAGVLPASVGRAVDKAANTPTTANIARVRKLIVGSVNLTAMGDDDARICIEIATSLLFHEAALGGSIANGACASMCLAQAMRDIRGGRPAEGWLALRAALRFAEDAREDLTATSYVPEPGYPQLTLYDALAGKFADTLGLVVSAQEAEMVDEDVVRGGAGAAPPEWADDISDLATILGPDPAPTLVVIEEHGLDHLPGNPTSGSSQSYRGATPRGEYQPMAGKAMPLIHGTDVQAARAELDREFPWLKDVTSFLLQDLVGARFTRLRPTLLLGNPGGGKTRFARRIAEVLGLHVTVYSAAGVADAAFGGTSRQWSTGRACVPLQAIQRAGHANPAIIIDEVEKGGTRAENGKLVDCLISALEPESARRFLDPYLEAPVDLSAVNYLATANRLDGLPAALLDRLRIVRVGSPRAQDLPVVAASIVAEIRAERGVAEEWMPDLEPDELDLLSQHWRGGSLRGLRRMVETVVSGRDALARRH